MDLRTELIEFLDGIREYVRESGTNIAHDERESSEFVDIHLQSKFRLDAVSGALAVDECKCIRFTGGDKWYPNGCKVHPNG